MPKSHNRVSELFKNQLNLNTMKQIEKMKKIITLTFAIIVVVATIPSCEKEKDIVPDETITVERTDVKTFEIVKLTLHRSLADSYSATFGSTTTVLLKASDSTLVFYVPEVLEGAAALEFELGKINFNIEKTQVADADQLVTAIFQSFDAQVDAMSASTAEEIADIDSLHLYKQNVLALFNSLSAEDKMKNAMFYEANKNRFNSFLTVFANTSDASTAFKTESQPDCSSLSNKKSRGLCIAGNIAKLADTLAYELAQVAEILEESPSIVSGVYLLATGARPQIIGLRRILTDFFNAKWILDDAIFNNIQTQFIHDEYTDLNLNAELRSINEAKDANFLNYAGEPLRFFDRIRWLGSQWNRFEFFGGFPAYVDVKQTVGLQCGDITITYSSPSPVDFPVCDPSSAWLKFNSLTGTEQNFNFHINVTKEGFVEEKDITNAKVSIVSDSTAIYRAACVGWWSVSSPTESLTLELFLNGQGTYHISGNPTTYPTTWRIEKSGNEYRFFESGFWHPAFDNVPRTKLTYPLTSFFTYDLPNPTVPVTVYTKN